MKAIKLFMILLLVFGCSEKKMSSKKEVKTMNKIMLTDENNNETLSVKVGDIIEISLKSNPTTGYKWFVKNELSEVKFHKKGDFIAPEQSELMGASGKQIFKFEIVKSGSFVIKLEYKRPWEKDIKPIKTFVINISAN